MIEGLLMKIKQVLSIKDYQFYANKTIIKTSADTELINFKFFLYKDFLFRDNFQIWLKIIFF